MEEMKPILAPKEQINKNEDEYDFNFEKSPISQLHDMIMRQLPKESDAIVWEQGDMADRVKKCVELFSRGLAPKIILSGGADDGSIKARDIKTDFLESGVREDNLILEDKSKNTKDVAVNILDLAQNSNWSRIIIVANPYHIFRTFLTFLAELKKRGLDRQIEIINAPADTSWFRKTPWKGREEGDLFLDDELPRLKKYAEKGDVSRPSEGVAYLNYWKNVDKKEKD